MISEFGIESVEYLAGAKYAELLQRTNVPTIRELLAQAPSIWYARHTSRRRKRWTQWWSRTTLL